jgi:hypothetical protein
MSRPSPDEQPTSAIPQQTVEQPAVSTAPATQRAGSWHRRIPGRIGKARTSTVVIGCLFVLLYALNSTLPREDATSPVVLPSGQTIQVRDSDLPDDYVPPTTAPTPATNEPVPSSSVPGTTAGPSGTTAGPSGTSTAPRTTAGTTTTPSPTRSSARPSPTGDEDRSTAATTPSRAPSTGAEPSASEEPGAEETSSAPTS